MRILATLIAVHLATSTLRSEEPEFRSEIGDALLAEYFQLETARVTQSTADALTGITTLEEWETQRTEYREQLQEMLGLSPWPERTPLNAEVVRTIEHDDFVVEMLHYQSSPGLYVTANLYRPKVIQEKLPAVLYVCGHARVHENGVSYGNKVGYHHHGGWFARNGYICLMIDTIQLGEIEGLHHGTYKEGMWWWASRGYTPAGVEAWNGIRGLDYLETRADVDTSKMGVTGRSGGGAYSWWIAALDERIQCAVPVAGITSMQNHIVDDCIEGHCDCMFMVNTYQWDFPLVAALVAPRPLLISNTDKDGIFPLDGVVDVHRKVRHIYDLYKKPEQLGLHITEGPHKDTQELRAHAFVWMNRFLKGSEADITIPALKLFQPPDLKVFETLPADEKVTTVHQWFAPKAEISLPTSHADLLKAHAAAAEHLKTQSLRAWPAEPLSLDIQRTFLREQDGVRLEVLEYTSQHPYRLPLIIIRSANAKVVPTTASTEVCNEVSWRSHVQGLKRTIADLPLSAEPLQEEEHAAAALEWQMMVESINENPERVIVMMAPRGIGPTEWTRDERERIHIQRRFLLLGQSLDGMRAWDIKRGMDAIQTGFDKDLKFELRPGGGLQAPALCCAILEPRVSRLYLGLPPSSWDTEDALLNVMKQTDFAQLTFLSLAHAEQVTCMFTDESQTQHWRKLLAPAAEDCGVPPERLQLLTGKSDHSR